MLIKKMPICQQFKIGIVFEKVRKKKHTLCHQVKSMFPLKIFSP